jgi:hypothetical protein
MRVLVATVFVTLACESEAPAPPAVQAAPATSGATASTGQGPRYMSPLISAAPAAEPAAVMPSSSTPAPAGIPSVVVGKAACDACLEAERAGRYLTPQGVGHYLTGCDDDVARKRCLEATRRSLPKNVKQLATQGKCDEARSLVQFGERNGAVSPALRPALGSCSP